MISYLLVQLDKGGLELFSDVFTEVVLVYALTEALALFGLACG